MGKGRIYAIIDPRGTTTPRIRSVTRRVKTPPLRDWHDEDREFARAFESMTAEQQRLVRLVGEGQTVVQLAEQLFISPQTVKGRLVAVNHILAGDDLVRKKRIVYLVGRYDAQWEQRR